MILGLHHVSLATSDMSRMLGFYRDAIGFELVGEGGWEAGSAHHDAMTALADSACRYVILRLGHTYLEIFAYSSPEPKPPQANRRVCDTGIAHFGLAVVDIEAEYKRLKAAGIRFHNDPGLPRPARAIYARDPEGNVFELIEFEEREHPFGFRCASAATDERRHNRT